MKDIMGLKFMPKVLNSDGIINNIKIKIMPCLSDDKKFFILGLFDHPKKILEPSNGGTGIKLNTPSETFNIAA